MNVVYWRPGQGPTGPSPQARPPSSLHASLLLIFCFKIHVPKRVIGSSELVLARSVPGGLGTHIWKHVSVNLPRCCFDFSNQRTQTMHRFTPPVTNTQY